MWFSVSDIDEGFRRNHELAEERRIREKKDYEPKKEEKCKCVFYECFDCPPERREGNEDIGYFINCGDRIKKEYCKIFYRSILNESFVGCTNITLFKIYSEEDEEFKEDIKKIRNELTDLGDIISEKRQTIRKDIEGMFIKQRKKHHERIGYEPPHDLDPYSGMQFGL
ncbi:MAG: hypothetical protein ISS95_00660 [Candidatus Aenigmarchaeota archaeon]|nr:hypothetical protein [Candidatus Aenigmarchaeota archaeon]